MDDDLIDDSGFELGMPTRVEMLNHQCDLLCSELETTRRDLRRAHKTIAGMIVMYRDCTKELAALKVEHERVQRRLSEFYEADRIKEISRLTYAYGNHDQKAKR
ncbi:hypothetical protein [Pseudomonas sp. URMO17WK12:I11]|uniref:hypothetical protein n=1 Tax=Pseudomonas sp. URMO17WK12:I11 TaxID=1283291 RepID=UPI000721454E|nr:hypothetical protein [Pseudomonas sp. URMO17WK12:I11]CRL48348.1 hypothetical protein PSHI_14020 [Pseudomonas sp. URMO17WK12:I11]